MAPEGVRVVSALHTVSAASLSDLDASARPGRAGVRRPRADKREAAAADRAHRRPALRRLRAPRDGAHDRVADGAADRASTPRYKAHAGDAASRACPSTLLGVSASARCEVVVLAGGTGGAKLARGLADVVGAERLTAIVNTGDDIEIYGAYVSPDPDLVSFWLADLIDERGWGLRGDTFAVMDALRELGAEVWFNLGDRDLAWCLERARLLAEGLAHRGARAAERGDRRARARAADERRPGAHVGPHAGAGLARLPGVHDPRARRRAGRGARVPRRRAGRGRARAVLAAIAARATRS